MSRINAIKKLRTLYSAVLVGTIGAQAHASSGSFADMPSLPGFVNSPTWGVVISRDGQTIAGHFGTPSTSTGAFKWDLGSTPVTLPSVGTGVGFPTGITWNGELVAGTSFTNGSAVATNWKGTAAVPLPLPAGVTASVLTGISGSEQFAVGNSNLGGFIYHAGTATFSSASVVAVSQNGQYVILEEGGASLRNLSKGTTTPVPAPVGSTLVGVDHNGTIVGYDAMGSFTIAGSRVTRLPNLPGQPPIQSASISPDGSAIVGLVPGMGGFIWTPQWGTRAFGPTLAGQIPTSLGLQVLAQHSLCPQSVTVYGGTAWVAGLDSTASGATAFVASLGVAQTGYPIDLSGTYLAVKNSVVAATTDPIGIPRSAGSPYQVLEPATAFISAPFSDALKPPAALSKVSMLGHSYWFDVDLGNPSSWPDPNSISNWFAGQAYIGQVGAEFVVRAAASTANGIQLGDTDGLTIGFYRKDGRFWGHVTNLWYDQDIDIPASADATQFHVTVSVAPDPGVTVSISQSNGRAALIGDPTVVTALVGGSTDNIGLTSASFMAALYSMADPTTTTAPPTAVTISGFGTDAVPDSIYAFTDNPYANTPYIFGRVDAANLTASLTKYLLGLNLRFNGMQLPASLLFGGYENAQHFPGPAAPFPGYPLNHEQSGGSGSQDLLLESFALSEPLTGTAGPLTLDISGPSLTTATGLYRGVHLIPGSVANSNAVEIDQTPPMIRPLSAAVGAQTLASSNLVLPGQLLTLTANAGDTGSGLAGFPTLSATATDINGKLIGTPQLIPMGTTNAGGGFSANYAVPPGTQALAFSVSVGDRAGNAATPQTLSLHAGLTTSVHLTGATIAAHTSVQRVLRIVLAGPGVPPITVNKVVTFGADGLGALQLTDADGLSYPASAAYSSLWVKDPYHTLGKSTPMTIVNGAYLLGTSVISLRSGDANNDNVIDVNDLVVYAALLSGWAAVHASTTQIVDFTQPLTPAEEDPDFNADNALNDYAFILRGNGRVGDPDPSLAPPTAPMTSLTDAQAAALGTPAWVIATIDSGKTGHMTFAQILAFIKFLQPNA